MKLDILAVCLAVNIATTSSVIAEGNPENGKLLAGRCGMCHGDGNARSTSFQVVPMLAGQPESYLVREMQNYANGIREDTSRNGRMTAVLQSLSAQDIEDIAAYFEAQERY